MNENIFRQEDRQIEDKGNLVKCSICEGQRVVIREFCLLEVCKKCGGEGKIDWVDDMMGRKAEEMKIRFETISRAILRSNVSYLISLIIEMYARVGLEVDVRIDDLTQKNLYRNSKFEELIKG